MADPHERTVADAIDAVRRGEIETAEAVLDDLLARHPDDAPALGLAGAIAFDRGDAALAAERFTRAAAAAPSDPAIAANLAHALLAAGEDARASVAYERAIVLGGDSGALRLGLATALRRNGDLARAIEEYRLAIAGGAALAEAWNGLGIALKEDGCLPEAERAYREAIAVGPPSAALHVNLGNAVGDQGRGAEALEAYELALAIDPACAEARFNAFAALFDDDPRRAEAMLEAALAAAPDHGGARFHLGALAGLRGEGDRAAQLLEGQPEHLASSLDFVVDERRRAEREGRAPARIFTDAFRLLAHAIATCSVDGLSIELGVRWGTSIAFLARAEAPRAVHGFDSFEGLPDAWGPLPEGTYSTRGELPVVPPNVVLHRGWFAETLAPFLARAPGPIRLLHVDCDLYRSTKDAFDVLAPRLVPGTVVVFDDYLCNPGWRGEEHRALVEAAAARPFAYDYLAFNLFARQAAIVVR